MFPVFGSELRNVKGAMSRFAHLEKFSLNFSSSSFVIRINLLHPLSSLFLYGVLLSLWWFSILVNYYFQVSFNLKVILYVAKIKYTKYRDWATLRLFLCKTGQFQKGFYPQSALVSIKVSNLLPIFVQSCQRWSGLKRWLWGSRDLVITNTRNMTFLHSQSCGTSYQDKKTDAFKCCCFWWSNNVLSYT